EPLSLQPISGVDSLTIEGESLWPPLDQQAGYALPEYASGTCASAGRWLAIHAETPGVPAAIHVDLPAPFAAGRRVIPRVAPGPGARGEVALTEDGAVIRRWPVIGIGPGLTCVELEGAALSDGARKVVIALQQASAEGGEQPIFALDRVGLAPQNSIDR